MAEIPSAPSSVKALRFAPTAGAASRPNAHSSCCRWPGAVALVMWNSWKNTRSEAAVKWRGLFAFIESEAQILNGCRSGGLSRVDGRSTRAL